MKKLIFFTALITMYFLVGLFTPVFAQADRLTTGELTLGDSTVTFYSAGREWIHIFLTDPAATSDTIIAEIKNPIDGSWITLGVKDQAAETYITEMIPTASVSGKLYIVWMLYSKNIRLRRTDVHNLSEVMEYAIQTEGPSQ